MGIDKTPLEQVSLKSVLVICKRLLKSVLIVVLFICVSILCFQLFQFEDMHRLCVTRYTEELAIRTEGQRADADIPADTHKANMENMRLHTKQLHSLNVCRGLMH